MLGSWLYSMRNLIHCGVPEEKMALVLGHAWAAFIEEDSDFPGEKLPQPAGQRRAASVVTWTRWASAIIRLGACFMLKAGLYQRIGECRELKPQQFFWGSSFNAGATR